MIEIGSIFYKFIYDKLILLRLKCIDTESNTYTFIDLNSKELVSVNNLELRKYTKLAPIGILKIVKSFNLDKLDRAEILLIFSKYKSSTPAFVYKLKDYLLYANNTLENSIDNNVLNLLIGLYSDNKIVTKEVAVYLDDTLDDIMQFIDRSIYNAQIFNMYRLYKNIFNNHHYPINFKQLMEQCNIISSIHINLGINFIDIYDINEIPIYDMEVIIGHKISKYICIPYDKTIDLSMIVYDYKLIRLLDNNVYIFAYEIANESASEETKMDVNRYLNAKMADMLLKNKALY